MKKYRYTLGQRLPGLTLPLGALCVLGLLLYGMWRGLGHDPREAMFAFVFTHVFFGGIMTACICLVVIQTRRSIHKMRALGKAFRAINKDGNKEDVLDWAKTMKIELTPEYVHLESKEIIHDVHPRDAAIFFASLFSIHGYLENGWDDKPTKIYQSLAQILIQESADLPRSSQRSYLRKFVLSAKNDQICRHPKFGQNIEIAIYDALTEERKDNRRYREQLAKEKALRIGRKALGKKEEEDELTVSTVL